MRCPPGLVFDDSYQRCEWPSPGSPLPHHRLGSLRDKKSNDDKNGTKSKIKKLHLMATIKQFTKTATPSTTITTTTTITTSTTATKITTTKTTTVSSTNQTKLVAP